MDTKKNKGLMMTQIILASNSPRRKKILTDLGLEFKIIPSNYEEKLETDIFSYDLIEDLATQKACDVVRRVGNNEIVLGADTVVVLHNKILGKPKNKDDAYRMLKELSAQTHMVVTSLCGIKSIPPCVLRFMLLRFKDTQTVVGDISKNLATSDKVLPSKYILMTLFSISCDILFIYYYFNNKYHNIQKLFTNELKSFTDFAEFFIMCYHIRRQSKSTST